MAKLLFVVHGMGDNLPGWSKDLVDFLDVALSQYPPFDAEEHPFRERVKIEEICYDPVFDKTIEPWGREREKLDKWARDNGIKLDDTLTELGVGQLPQATTGFVWETLLDPVLYRGSPIVHDRVREVVIKQFLEAWDKHLRSTPGTAQLDVSILCHSQGTIVMSDVLAIVGEARLPEFVPFSAEKRSIECLMTLANVSRLGPTPLIDIDSLTTCVRPQTALPWSPNKKNYLRRFINARHKLDPFCFFQRFTAPASWGNRYRLIDDVDHIHQANTHGYTHYLANPRVHIPFFRAVLDADAISPAKEQAAIAAFPPILPPDCAAAIATLRKQLAVIRDGPFQASKGLDEWVTKGISFFKAVKEAVDACSSLVEGLADD